MPNSTVGWALMLDGEGNAVWNKTYLEGSGTELRYAINLTDGFLFVGNEFFASGEVNGFVVRTDSQGTPVWNTTLGTGEGVNKLFSAISHARRIRGFWHRSPTTRTVTPTLG